MSVRASAFVFVCAAIAAALSSSKATDARDPNPAMNQPDKYAWQVFIRLNHPAAQGKPDAIWETWISDDDAFPQKPDPQQPPQWPTSVGQPKVLKTSLQLLLTRQLEEKAAVGIRPLAPLQATKEEVRRNKVEFDFIVANKLWYLEGVEEAFKAGPLPPIEQSPFSAILHSMRRLNQFEWRTVLEPLIAFDSNKETVSSTRSTGTFLCGEMARNQSGRLSGSMWRNSNGAFFSRKIIAERCTQGHVLKLTSMYFAMSPSLRGVEWPQDGMPDQPAATQPG